MMKILLLILLFVLSSNAEERMSLDGTWNLRNKNGTIQVNGRVPGGVFSDLEETGVLKESIYYRLNDQVYKWVGRDDWTYSRSFDLSEEILNKQLVNLVLHGADTLGEVILNGERIGLVSNMYVRYVIPIKNIAKPTNNSLEVRFFSPVTSAAKIFAGKERLYPPTCKTTDPNIGECHINMIRKMPCSFGWDWAPPYASMGLFKSVEIEATDSVVIRDVTTSIVKTANTWEVAITIFGEKTGAFDGEAEAILNLPNGEKVIASGSIRQAEANDDIITSLNLSVGVEKVALWWPNGYGDQTLYDLDVILRPQDDSEVTKTVRIGFRTVEIVQDVITEGMNGTTFYFKVNSVPVFAKGANWLPAALIPEKGYDGSYIRHMIQSAKEAHMNMFRVWGGGTYESDTFYSIADELGIMIWQDFMFSDAIYPVDEPFLSSVATEVSQQIKRLQHHPCIAIWSGNNENEGVLTGMFSSGMYLELYKGEYRKLYIETIKGALDVLDPVRYYVGSSPSNGIIEEFYGYTHPDAGSDTYGDVHYYNYNSDGWSPASYPPFRFVSEFGSVGMNSFEEIKKVSVPSDWFLRSNFSLSRNRRDSTGAAYDQLTKLIDFHLPLPADDNSLEFLQLYIYYSQINQAMSIKTMSEKFRRDRDLLTPDNKGRTMGALFWMLNDVWQGPTWASIEFGGRWKLLHYYAKKFFAPALISMAPEEDGSLSVFLVSDEKEDVPKLNVQIMIMSYDSFAPKWMENFQADLKAGLSYSIWNTDSTDRLLAENGCESTKCFFHVTLTDYFGDLVSGNFYFPSRFHDVVLPPTNIKVEIIASSDTSVTLRLTSDAIAVFVWLETAVSGIFSDNGFVMTFTQEEITFETRGEALDLEGFRQTLSLRDLYDTTPRLVLIH